MNFQHKKKRIAFITAALSLLCHFAFSQAGVKDYTFGVNGKTIFTVTPVDEYIMSTKVDGAGNIFSAGIFNPTVTLANSWGYFVSKHLPNGQADNSFATNGVLIDTVGGGAQLSGLAVTSAGSVIAVGSLPDFPFHPFLIKLTPSGAYDASFGVNGRVKLTNLQNVALTDVHLLSNGKILASAAYYNGVNDYDFALMQFNADGSTNLNFGVNGLVVLNNLPSYELIEGMSVQPDGKILLVGRQYNVFDQSKGLLMRLNSNGQPDNTFGTNSKAVISPTVGSGYCALLDVTVQPDGKILCSGFTIDQVAGPTAYINYFLITRHLSNGTPDTSFGSNGILISDIYVGAEWACASVLQADGKIVTVGNTGENFPSMQAYFAVARYLPNGGLDTSFNSTGIIVENVSGTEGQASVDINICPDGGILASGVVWDHDTTFKYNSAYVKYKSGVVITATYTSIGDGNQGPSKEISVSPNPVKDLLKIQLKGDHGDYPARLTDVTGKTVATFGVNEIFDTSQLPDGLYILSVETGLQRYYGKVVVRH